MDAVEFVKKFGWREVKGFYNWASENKSNFAPEDFKLTVSGGESISYLDLKRIVESHELVESWGGLKDALALIRYALVDHPEVWKLRKAIADVESFQ